MLRRAGYIDADTGADAPMGTFRMIPGGIEVLPGAESYHSTDGAKILDGPDGRVDRILGVGANAGRSAGFLRAGTGAGNRALPGTGSHQARRF